MSLSERTWIRDNSRPRNKWHAVEETYISKAGDGVSHITACGYIFDRQSYRLQPLPVGSEPVDSYGVCLTCSRWAEIETRNVERVG